MLFNGIIIQNITDEAYDEYDDYDGGMSINQLNAALLKRGLEPSAKFTKKFHELDTNKDGLLEKNEVASAAEAEEGEDYFIGMIVAAIIAASGAVASATIGGAAALGAAAINKG